MPGMHEGRYFFRGGVFRYLTSVTAIISRSLNPGLISPLRKARFTSERLPIT